MANEKRLIDANAVIEKLTNFTPNGWGKDVPYIRSQWAMAVKIKDNFLKAITDAPTVDAVEVVHGRWIEDYETFVQDNGYESEPIHTGFVCSVCGRHSFAIEPYCHCGAKMDGDGNG